MMRLNMAMKQFKERLSLVNIESVQTFQNLEKWLRKDRI